MNYDWCDELRKSYKDKLSVSQFGVGIGWKNIIESLFSELSEYINKNNIENFRIVQIKEKFGGLRVYTNMSDDIIDGIIIQKYNEAENTCESCGKPGFLQEKNDWVKCLCEECAKIDD